jgi:hypothetical protein
MSEAEDVLNGINFAKFFSLLSWAFVYSCCYSFDQCDVGPDEAKRQKKN